MVVWKRMRLHAVRVVSVDVEPLEIAAVGQAEKHTAAGRFNGAHKAL